MSNTNYAIPPGHYLKEWLTENGVTIDGAIQFLDIDPDVVLDLLNGNTELLATHAKSLAEVTGIPADTWLRYETQYQADTARLAATTDPNLILGWCTGYEPDPDDLTTPKYWWLYLHTTDGHHRISDLTFPNEQAARRWATTTLRGLTEYE